MSKIGLIIKREYIQRVSKKSFLLLTFLTPLLFAALVFVPLWLSTIKSDEVKKIAVLDSTHRYDSQFKSTPEFEFIIADGNLENYRKQEDKQIDAFLSITGNLLEHPKAATLYSEKQIPLNMKKEINSQLGTMLQNEKIQSFQIPDLEKIIQEKPDFF